MEARMRGPVGVIGQAVPYLAHKIEPNPTGPAAESGPCSPVRGLPSPATGVV